MQLSRKHFLLTSLTAATGTALAACSGSNGSGSGGSGDGGTRTITDHGDKQVTLPATVTRVAIDQIPIESTYIAYFDGSAPNLVGMSAARVAALKDTIAAEIAPEILEVDTSYYDNGELNVESLLALNVDVVLYNASNDKHGQLFEQAGIPAVGFTTEGDPTSTYADWMHLLEDVFDEPGKMTDKIALGTGYVEDAQARAAQIAEADKLSTFVLMGVKDGMITVAAGTEGWFTDSWAKRMNYTDSAKDLTGSAAPTELETVLGWDPDCILVTGKGMSDLTAKDILAGSAGGVDFTQLKAYENKAVYSTGLGMWNWFTPNPDAPLAAYWVGSSLYPDKFTDIDLPALTKDYYKQMYAFDLTDDQVTTIINPDA
ncbi:ABC transporter substrate-binding protein [Actinomyces massiliensis]|jgi:ABC transporter, substrate-binding protein|uniref:Oligopeptide ABC transporter, oligopeptide-binding protein n=1 Tax=Actinomyces massiliensis F0489 TaxID=1125718 RepID=J0N2N5_9ACTO|nr:ABC transporter substrate-binding protein [Actinomyces massiliensis]EJF38622.1 oligopeptide ABC transporter, oligopeptide-binding protein [Actinomyces massiliensis F0489]WLD71510.1 ABC transporter substrate-binding protein [Actinomyces massiliensis]